jgi:CDP-paratose 2-epimerase
MFESSRKDDMSVALITGSAGLIGSESVAFFSSKFDFVIGIDNNLREYFFGIAGSTDWNRERLQQKFENYRHYNIDIRKLEDLENIFQKYSTSIKLIIHTAAQPSHDWATREPFTDFSVNATGTLDMLEMCRRYCPDSVFIFTSTNKVYGDNPNLLPLYETETRWEVACDHPFALNGIDETMSIDHTKHSLFGASKVAADILVQEYGKYFTLKTGVFRAGCLTGSNHSGTQLHGFLSYLMKCTIKGDLYTIFGYKGKQVRDSMHSFDLVNMFWHFYQNPRAGEVYNVGGGRHANCSILEAISMCDQITGNRLNYTYEEANRNGDHIWYISDVSKFKRHFPEWNYTYDLKQILTEIYLNMTQRLSMSV